MNLRIMKPDTKGFLMYDPIYMAFSKYKIIETEIRSVLVRAKERRRDYKWELFWGNRNIINLNYGGSQ